MLTTYGRRAYRHINPKFWHQFSKRTHREWLFRLIEWNNAAAQWYSKNDERRLKIEVDNYECLKELNLLSDRRG